MLSKQNAFGAMIDVQRLEQIVSGLVEPVGTDAQPQGGSVEWRMYLPMTGSAARTVVEGWASYRVEAVVCLQPDADGMVTSDLLNKKFESFESPSRIATKFSGVRAQLVEPRVRHVTTGRVLASMQVASFCPH
jgi:uncharacterized protein (DUF697 family)